MIDAKVADHVLGEEQFVIEIGLEIRIVSPSVGVDLVLVGVEQPRIGMPIDRFCNPIEGVCRQHVVMVDEGDKIPCGHLERRVRSGSYVSTGITKPQLDSAVFGRVPLKQFADPRCGRGIIGNAQLPMDIDLIQNRTDRLIQNLQWGVADRHHHRDGGPLGKHLGFSP